MPKPDQLGLSLADGIQLSHDGVVELTSVRWGEVTQSAILQPSPQALDRIEHGRIGWKPFQTQPRSKTLDSLTNRISFMHGSSIPNDDQAPRKLAHQRLEEQCRTLVVEVTVDQRLVDQPHAIAVWRQPKSCGNRHPLTVFTSLLQDRRLATECPSAPNQRGHQQTTLIDQDQVGPLSMRFFLILGHSVASQAAMTSGLRSRGTRSGFCKVKSWDRSQRRNDRGCNATSHSSSTNWASRDAVHSSVAKPNSVGLSFSQRSMIFSCVCVNFLGRPGTGCAAKARHPPWRTVATHRRTLRQSTPRKSATFSAEYPSSTRRTARQRRCSSSTAAPLFLMP